jgi:hypothetical protein
MMSDEPLILLVSTDTTQLIPVGCGVSHVTIARVNAPMLKALPLIDQLPFLSVHPHDEPVSMSVLFERLKSSEAIAQSSVQHPGSHGRIKFMRYTPTAP